MLFSLFLSLLGGDFSDGCYPETVKTPKTESVSETIRY